MMNGAIYIDDAGTPGVIPPSEFLPEDRKSYCAVIVPENVRHPVNEAMGILLQGVMQDFGVGELHCTDIYSGRGSWKEVEVIKRIELFDFLESIIVGFKLPVLFQTWSASSMNDHHQFFSKLEMKKDSWWDLNNISHASLLLLCFQIAKEIRGYKKNLPEDFRSALTCYIDEDLVKAGTKIKLPAWNDVFESGDLNFVTSDSSPGIQLADFAAFCIARSQWVMAKQSSNNAISDADLHIIKIASKINWINSKQVLINTQEFSRDGYEFLLMRDRMEKKLTKRFNKKK